MTIDEMKQGVTNLPTRVEVFGRESRKVAFWKLHNCSMCGYPCGYMVNLEKKEGDVEVLYDNGCDCGFGRSMRHSSFEEMFESYNMQTNTDVRLRIAKEFSAV